MSINVGRALPEEQEQSYEVQSTGNNWEQILGWNQRFILGRGRKKQRRVGRGWLTEDLECQALPMGTADGLCSESVCLFLGGVAWSRGAVPLNIC